MSLRCYPTGDPDVKCAGMEQNPMGGVGTRNDVSGNIIGANRNDYGKLLYLSI